MYVYIYISTLWDIIHQCNHNYIAYILSKICFSQTTKSEILREKELRISVYKVVPQFVNAKLVQISPILLWFIGVEVVNGIIHYNPFITGGAPPCGNLRCVSYTSRNWRFLVMYITLTFW